MLPKGPAVVFVPSVVGRRIVCILSSPHRKPAPSPSCMAPHPRPADLKGARGRRCPFPPLPLALRACGAWQNVEEGLVLVLTEGCLQICLNSILHSTSR